MSVILITVHVNNCYPTTVLNRSIVGGSDFGEKRLITTPGTPSTSENDRSVYENLKENCKK